MVTYHNILYAFIFLGGNLFDLYNQYMDGQRECQFIDAIECWLRVEIAVSYANAQDVVDSWMLGACRCSTVTEWRKSCI
jgi:hypothetical protein